jgi:hypothetical protein
MNLLGTNSNIADGGGFFSSRPFYSKIGTLLSPADFTSTPNLMVFAYIIHEMYTLSGVIDFLS